jgi:Fur family ferric uptake transcriptional regulator
MPKRDNFREVLRKGGHKATPSRLAILDIFGKTRNPMSAQEIIETLPSDTDQATVYRTLKLLKEKGVIKQIDLRHNHAHYELANIAEHHHLVCLRCGRIEDVERCGVEAIQSTILKNSKHFAEIQQHTLEFYGICKTCAKKSDVAKIEHYKNAPL